MVHDEHEMKVFKHCRRENGLTVRYLAQGIINDTMFPDRRGIAELFGAKCGSFVGPVRHRFFFHLEDFGVGDKSELDLLLWDDEYLYPVEIKGFTNPNSTDVKREIVRNCRHLASLSKDNWEFFAKREIKPILLYCRPYFEWKNPSHLRFNYFSPSFLIRKGEEQDAPMDNWDKGGYPIPDAYLNDMNEFNRLAREYSRRMVFLTWDDVYESTKELNAGGRFDRLLSEMTQTRDTLQDPRGIALVNPEVLGSLPT